MLRRVDRIEIRHLKYFLTLARALNFARAAEQLNMTQPPLTRQIRQLEETLGVELFARTTRSVELTEAGRVFVPEAEAILSRIEQGVAAVRREILGERESLVLGIEASLNNRLISRSIGKFRSQNSNDALVVRSLDTDEQIQALVERKIDVGFVVPPVVSEEVEVETILRIPLIAVVPEGHFLDGKRGVSLAELASEPFVLSSPDHRCGLYDQVIASCGRAGFVPKAVQEAHDMQLMLGLVAEGFGVTLLPEYVEDLHWPGIAHVQLVPHSGEIDLAIAWRREDGSKALSEFISVVRDCCGDTAPKQDAMETAHIVPLRAIPTSRTA